MYTKTSTMKTIVLALAGALLATSASLAETAPVYEFDKIKLRPLVTNDVTKTAVPKEVSASFETRFRKETEPLRKQDFAKGVPLAEALLKDFAAYPGLVCRVKEEYANQLARDRKHYADAIRLYDELIAMAGRPSARVTWYLGRKRELQEKLGKRLEANETLMRTLEQPELTQGARDGAKHGIIRNLIGHKFYKEALALALPLVNSEETPPESRASIGLTAADCARRYLNDHDQAYDIYVSIENLPVKGEWTRLERAFQLSHAYIGNKTHGPQYAKSKKALEAVYGDKTVSPEPRYHAMNALLKSRVNAPEKAEPLSVIPVALAFLEEVKGRLSNAQHYIVLLNCLELYERHGVGDPRRDALALSIYQDEKAPFDSRIRALYFITKGLRKAGETAKEEKLYRAALPLAKESPKTIAGLLDHIADIYFRENDPDKMTAIFGEAYRYNDTPEMTNQVTEKIAGVYKRFSDFPKAVDHYLSQGKKRAAAELCGSWDYQDRDLARKLWKEIFDDAKAPTGDRLAAYEHLFDGDDFARENFRFYAEGMKNNAHILNFLFRKMANGGYAYNGSYEKLVTSFELYDSLARPLRENRHYRVYKYAVSAYLHVGDVAKAAAAAKEAATCEWVKCNAAERYAMEMLADLLPRKGDRKALEKACAKADKRFAGEIPAKDRVRQFDVIGSAMNIGRLENHVRALDAYRNSLYVPAPRRSYTVEFCEKPVVGVGNWDRLSKKPVEAKMDRTFGGSMDFLETDVATGDRGQGIGTEKAKADRPKPSFSAVCDVYGLHLRFYLPTKEARDIENGTVGGGAYEGYIAPGEGQPYICLLQDVQSGRLEPYNTAYTTANHTRIMEKDTRLHRAQTIYTDDAVISYIFLSWEAYATLIPENGTTWDFENVYWSRTGGDAWNGTESIHGRSTWGQLVFDLPDHDRARILKRLLFTIKPRYFSERWTGSAREDVADFWKDDEIGDPAFYEECVKPLVEKLDSYFGALKKEMSDEEVFRLADEALPAWVNFRYTVARLREQYLERELMEEETAK